MEGQQRDPRVDDVFKQLDGALCIWARAKGEKVSAQYTHDVSPKTWRIMVGNVVLQVDVTNVEDVK